MNWGRGLLAVGLFWGFLFGMAYFPTVVVLTLVCVVTVGVTFFIFVIAAGGK